MHRLLRNQRTRRSMQGGWAITVGVSTVCLLIGLLGAASAAQLSVTWIDASTNEDGFKVERKVGTNGTYSQIATLAAGTSGYVDSPVTTGTTYCYRVRASNSAGDSAYSNEACAAAATATLYTVAATKSGTGTGTITSSPGAIACGSACSASVASGTSIALSATPAPGSTFTGWSGACSGTGSCTFVVDSAKRLTATFASTTSTTPSPGAQATYTLTATKAGNGSGLIASSPAGVYCGATCQVSFQSGTSVTLAAVTTARSTFVGWSGACKGTGVCTLTLTAPQAVTATFTRTRWRYATH